MASINPVSVTPQATTMQTLPSTGLASPYDGTSPTLGSPITGSQLGGTVPQLSGIGGSRPQVNATNQTAFAPNGDVNQTVTNENQYSNKYYNIIVPQSGGLFGGWGGVGNLFGGVGSQGSSFIDPATGVLYVQRDQGITGWFKRLFRGY